jgi:hypothetical protein
MAVGLVTFPARLMEQDAQEYAERFRAYEQSGYEGWQAVAREQTKGHNQTLLEMVPGIGTGRRLGEAWEACSNTGLSFECGQKAFPAGVSVVADATVVYGVASKATQLSRVGARAATTEATVGGGAATTEVALESEVAAVETSVALQRYIEAPMALQRMASEAHLAAGTARAVEKSAVAVVRVRLASGEVTYYASGSGAYLRPAQRAVLEKYGVPRENILSGARYSNGFSQVENHAERVILRNMPEGSAIEDWGISWTTTGKPKPCPT